MLKVPEPKTKNQHETTWDGHGSYQWTYFADEIKQRIEYFLTQRLHGNNIEVGGGWYLSYPDSVVVDLSSVCLESNPAKDKFQFDLDTIGEGNQLPYKDNSFNSATLISAWQYLQHPREVLGELERILRPGSEIYLINGQGAGLKECIVGASKTESLEQFFQGLGYDTLVEHIPDLNGGVREFQSVCVAMPERDLFGEAISRIKNKEERQKQDEEVCQDSSIFMNAYRDWEIRNQVSRLAKLSTFPVTKFSQEYLERIESFSQEYSQETGGIPLVFVEHGFEPELAMMLPDNKFFRGAIFLMGVDAPVTNGLEGPEDAILNKHDLGFCRHVNYFKYPTKNSLLKACESFRLEPENRWKGILGNETELEKFADFIASLGLNSFTQQLQSQMYERLQPNVEDLEKRIQKQKGFGFYRATHAHKQKRNIDELLKKKARIESENIPVIETRKLDYWSLIPEMRKFVR